MSTSTFSSGGCTSRVTAWLTGALLALVGGSAMAVTVDFEAFANANEQGVADGTTLNFGGIDITFSADAPGNPGYAYFDADTGTRGFYEGPAGLGVCGIFNGAGDVELLRDGTSLSFTDNANGDEYDSTVYGGLDYVGNVNECRPGSDDNITEGETVYLSFPYPVKISGMAFRNAKHVDISNTDFTLLIDGEPTTFAVASAGEFIGSSISFAYGGNNPNQFYVRLLGEVIPLGALGDRVWIDTDGNDVQDCSDIDNSGIVGDSVADCNDSGFDGVDVALGTVENGVCVPTGDTATTANGGFYRFDGLDAGDYCVIFNKPAGYDCVAPDVVADDAVDSDGVDNGSGQCVTGTVTLAEGETNLSVDLGLVQPPLTASLGDRVWEDLNGNGKQDCVDGGATGGVADGIIGNVGDSGDECGAGVNGVPVYLGQPNQSGACVIGSMSTTTKNGGFYGFSGLPAGEYCVQFDLVTFAQQNPNFCTTDGFVLGDPLFTTKSQLDDASDSDANEDGSSDSVELVAGDNNLTLDAGIICPAKIGDYVWLDSNGDGTQNDGNTGVQGATAELLNCDGTSTGETRTTDANGMYMFGAELDFSLAPGCYKVKFTDPLGRDFTIPNGDGVDDALDSDCTAGQAGAINVGPRDVDLTNDCGVVLPPPNCDLELVKGCRVETPEFPEFAGDCKGKIQEFTLIWNGNDPITVSGVTNTAPGGVVKSGDEVTFSGPFSDNDVFVTINGSDYSVFHMSCSDDDFDGPEDCGAPAGDGKSNDVDAINLWALEGFVDAENKVLDCNTSPSDAPFLANCSFEAPTPTSCENSDKPRTLTFEYTGGGCDASDNGQASDKAVCVETVPGLNDAPVTTILAAGDDKFESDIYNVTFDGVLEKGDRVTIDFNGDSFKSTSFIQLQAGGAVETNEFHTSCSQPLAMGDVFGSLKLVGWDGKQDGVDVSYSYTLTNNGDDLEGIKIVDNPLGLIADGVSLASGDTAEFFSSAFLNSTTTNTATASTTLAGELCIASSDEVTVEAFIPPCNVSIKIDDVSDDALKIKLRNEDSRNRVATLESIVVTFPEEREQLKEVKLDGALYKLDDALKSGYEITGYTDVQVGPGINDGSPSAWTKDDLSKYQLDPGEERTLEIKTTKKSNKDEAVFEVTVKFAEGCEYTFTATKADKGTVLSF